MDVVDGASLRPPVTWEHELVVRGTVSEFDPARGLGTITSDDGRNFAFHAVEIADGSRSIEIGCLVRFRPLAKFGAFEAGSIIPA
ncbi:MAG: hypothetical protein HKN41_10250 [Ilumatobacter sp.]|nr:hypothetical protein [Ilumatobacter sp.]